jgi:ribosomal RNA-processing protein 12
METFIRVISNLETSLAEGGSQTQADKQKQDKSKDKMPPMSHTLMDLVITISIYLPRDSFPSLFQIAAVIVNKKDDPQLQKKAYKLIPRLAESTLGKAALEERNEELQQLLINSAEQASAPSRRDRLGAISQIIEFIPRNDLHFITAVLPEVVICAKEVNEKARTAAFDLLVAMGEKMNLGGTVITSKAPNMPSDAPSVEASLEEYFTMVSAGLAGDSAHMISATITAVTRILYEFRTRISQDTMSNLLEVMDMFLQNPNREIVRSVLGFVKVAVISLPEPLVLPRLKALVPNLMVWSHEHKAQFKAKVKHILERMIRRFGVENVERACPEEDKKLIANIRKTRDRRKRKKDAGGDDGEEDARPQRKGKFESEYDEAVYGSEDDDSGSDVSDEEVMGGRNGKRRRAGEKEGRSFIIEDDDEPLDLLSKRALGNISSTKPLKARQAPRQKTKIKRNEDGKLILGGPDSDDDHDGDVVMKEKDPGDGSLEGGINAYVDAIRGRDAAQRGRGGKLKFSNRKQKGGDDDEMEIDDDEKTQVAQKIKEKRRDGPGGARGGFKSQRRGLGVQKTSGGRVEKGGRGGSAGRGRGGRGSGKWISSRRA